VGEPEIEADYATYADPVMEMTLRVEIFPSDLDEVVDFYTRVLRFGVTKDQRHDPSGYVAMRRGAVQVGAARRALPDALRPGCLRPGGTGAGSGRRR
jgi:hypothetical protein